LSSLSVPDHQGSFATPRSPNTLSADRRAPSIQPCSSE